jgi:hypothetical protein
MSSMTLAPPLDLDGPVPVAPVHSLLAVAQIVPSDFRIGVGGEVWPYPPDLPQAFEPCSTGTFRVKSEGEGWDLPQFKAYELYLPITCSAITAHAPGFADRARIALQAKESFGVAKELATGYASGGDNPFLGDGNLNILAGGVAQKPDVALAWIEDAIGATAQQGIIHTTPAVGASMNGSGGYLLETVSGKLVTSANGTPVALDGGYIDVSPSLHAALNPGEGWMFATGPVQVRRGADIEMIAEDIAESMDRSDNVVTFRAEREYLVTWDVNLQVGVLVDWTPA